jgi:hypothetical protein
MAGTPNRSAGNTAAGKENLTPGGIVASIDSDVSDTQTPAGNTLGYFGGYFSRISGAVLDGAFYGEAYGPVGAFSGGLVGSYTLSKYGDYASYLINAQNYWSVINNYAVNQNNTAVEDVSPFKQWRDVEDYQQCFPKGTLVQIERGATCPIEHIKIIDTVASYDALHEDIRELHPVWPGQSGIAR